MNLVESATSARHGLVAAPSIVAASAADPPGVVHASVPRDDDLGRSAGGGAARDVASATTAAVAEALERFAAVHATVPVRLASNVATARRVTLAECTLHSARQRADDPFPHPSAYPSDEWLSEMFDLGTNQTWWVPAALVSLVETYGPLATSSGLAAAPSVVTALLRATQELIERDAYVTTWLHQLAGREVHQPSVADEFAALGGEARVFDLTPAFSPHPVALVAGTTYLAGRPRPSLGIACRARWSDAVEKAFVECCQGTVFVGHLLAARPDLYGMGPDRVTGFDEHAVYYGANPGQWTEVPLLRFAAAATPPADSPAADSSDADQLRELTTKMAAAGARLLYRELTTVDCNQIGLRIVRVVAPELTPLHHDHRWPYLGGRAADVRWRYPDADQRTGGRSWPSPFPHALG